MTANQKIDVIIPIYKPGEELFDLLSALQQQTIPVGRVILMNTEEKYFEQLIYGTHFYERFGQMTEVYHLSKLEFDHGHTRHTAVGKSTADIFVMMTQDAMPADNMLLERLVEQLTGKVAVAYARQLPREDCHLPERISREFNYPAESRLKSAEDKERLGIKTYFCSNVCAAYRRNIYEELGGFVHRTIFNEDMIYAAKAIEAGYQIAYVAEAKVIHSHNYTVGQQLHRNFDLGVSQAEYPEVFARVRSESEGMKMVKSTTRALWEQGAALKIPYFYLQCAGKYLGYFLGKGYRKLPRKLVLALTSSKEYWK